MIELAEQIFSQGGVLALVLVIVLVCFLLISYTMYLLVKSRRNDGKTVETQADAIANLVKHEAKITTMQAEISANQLKLAEVLSQHDKRAETIGAVLDKAVASMTEKSDERGRQLNELPGKVSDTMTPKLEELPRAIEEALAPKIEMLQADIQQLIQSLETKLSERIETATDEIPRSTHKLVREELAVLRLQIDTGLHDIIETAKRVQIPDEDSEPKTEEPEPGEVPASGEVKEQN